MARVQYGIIVTGLKGKLGGQVFQGGNTVQVLRNKNSRKGSDSSIRQQVNNITTSIVAHWRSITDADRTAWNTQASNWPFKDKFGVTYTGTGYQFHNAYQWGQLLTNQGFIDTPLTPISTEPVGTVSFAFSTSGAYTVSIPGTTTLSQVMAVYASAPISPAKNLNNPKLRLMFGFNTSGLTSLNIKPYYNNAFGSIPTGSTIVVQCIVRASDWPIGVKVITAQVTIGA